jgi:N4-gp56 family major capsid protein
MALPTVSSVVSSGLAAYPTIYYDRVSGYTLEHNLFFYPACNLKIMPGRSGTAMQVFTYQAVAAATTPATEGQPGSGTGLTQLKATINLSRYTNYVSYSDKVVLTTIDDTVAKGTALLSYGGALTIDTVILTAVDAQCTTNTSTDDINVATGSHLSGSIVREAGWELRSLDIHPKANGLFMGITHSVNAFDLVNDATAGGFLDLQKFADSTAPENPALVGIKGARIGNVGGVEMFESNNVTSQANWQGGGHIAYNSYVFGDEAFWASSLGKTNLGQKNFSVKTYNFPMGSNSLDPTAEIAAASVYAAYFGVVAAPTPAGTDRVRRIKAESTIG